MEFLVRPDISYILLILGFLAAILALLAPGTGVLELGALGVLALAGYGIANLPINPWAFGVMLLALLPAGLAVASKGRRRVLAASVAGLVIFVAAAFIYKGTGWLPAVSPVLILLTVPSATLITWFITDRVVQASAPRPSFDLDRLLGMVGQTSTDIRGQGTVYVDGEEWSANSAVFVPAGRAVRVLRRDGLVLFVEPIKE